MSTKSSQITEHSGAKKGKCGSFYGRKADAKATTKKIRREKGKKEANNSVKENEDKRGQI